jgi:hypothetical protein
VSIKDKLEALRERKEGWNDYDALPPHPDAIDAAKDWLQRYALGDLTEEHSSYLEPWEYPHVTSSAEGQVVLEWEHRDKKITVYVNPRRKTGAYHLDYVKSWGPDIELDMEDGSINSEGRWLELWNWLVAN